MKLVKMAAVLIAVVLLADLWGCRFTGRPPETRGDRAPAFTASLLGEGKEVRVPGDFGGRAVVLIFFSPG
ncbi:hypothetical protein [Thermodesulfitimonas sp.]